MLTVSLWRKVLLLCCLTIASTGILSASSGGITGVSTTGCGTCHGGKSANTSLSYTGPTTVAPGQTVTYTVSVAHGTHTYAGTNIAIKNANGQNAGTLAAGTGLRAAAGELTHQAPLAFNGGAATFEFQWTAPAVGGTYTLTAAGNAVNKDGTNSDEDDWNTMNAVSITVKGATITAPASGASFCAGSNATLTWTQNGFTSFRVEVSANGTAWDILSPSTTASAGTYTWAIPNNQPAGTGYRMRLVDPQTSETVAESATFTVGGAPNFLTQPASTEVCFGRVLSLSVSVQGGGNLQYRWRKNGTDIPGATAATYQVTSVTNDAAGTYDVVVFGCGQATSQSATVSVNQPPSVTLQPVNRTVCPGDTVSFSTSATGAGITYQWYRGSSMVASATSAKLSLTNVQAAEGGKYYCEVSGTCFPRVNTDTVTLTVRERPAISRQPVNQSVKVGDAIVLFVTARGTDLSYSWTRNGTVVPNATDDTLRIASASMADSGSYVCTVMNACSTAVSTAARVSVGPKDGPGILQLSSETVQLPTMAACTTTGTVVEGFLRNAGGTAITVTAIAVEPSTSLQVTGVTFPLTIEPGASASVTMRPLATTAGSVTATVSVTASTNNASASVAGLVTSGLAFAEDTLTVALDTERSCLTSLATACSDVVVTALQIEGEGAASFSVVEPSLPASVGTGTTFQVCLRATQSSTARLVVVSSAGADTLVLRTSGTTSVVDGESASLMVMPNPMSDHCTVSLGGFVVRTAGVYTLTGERVRSFDGVAGAVSLEWNGRDDRGAAVGNGMYILVVDHAGGRMTRRVIVQQ